MMNIVRIKSAEQVFPGMPLKIMLCGGYGTGKTTAASSFAMLGPMLYCNFDGNPHGISPKYADEFEIYGRCYYDDKNIYGFQEFLKDIQKLVDAEKCYYKVVVIDTLSFLERSALNSKESSGMKRRDNLYLQITDDLRHVMQMLSNLHHKHGVTIVLIDHTFEKGDMEDSGSEMEREKVIKAAVFGKQSEILPAWCSIVGYTFIESTLGSGAPVYCTRFVPKGKIVCCKNSLNANGRTVLNDVEVNFNCSVLQDRIKNLQNNQTKKQ